MTMPGRHTGPTPSGGGSEIASTLLIVLVLFLLIVGCVLGVVVTTIPGPNEVTLS